eukprot:gene9402-1648_t
MDCNGDDHQEVLPESSFHTILWPSVYVHSEWKITKPCRLSQQMLEKMCSSIDLQLTGDLSDGSVFIAHPAVFYEIQCKPSDFTLLDVQHGHVLAEDSKPDIIAAYFLSSGCLLELRDYLKPFIKFFNSITPDTQNESNPGPSTVIFSLHQQLIEFISLHATPIDAICREIWRPYDFDAINTRNDTVPNVMSNHKTKGYESALTKLRNHINQGFGLSTSRLTDFHTFGIALLWHISSKVMQKLTKSALKLTNIGLEVSLVEQSFLCFVGTRSTPPHLLQPHIEISGDNLACMPVFVPETLVDDLVCVVGDKDLKANFLHGIKEQFPFHDSPETFTHHSVLEIRGFYLQEIPFATSDQLLSILQILRQATTLLEVLYSAWYRHDLASGCITVQPGGNIRLNCTSVSTSSTNPAAEHQPTLLPVQTNQHHCENQLNESHNTNHSPLAHIRDGRQTDSKLQQQQQEKDQKQENKEDRQPHQKVERQEEDVSVANADLALVCLLQQLVASDIICRR